MHKEHRETTFATPIYKSVFCIFILLNASKRNKAPVIVVGLMYDQKLRGTCLPVKNGTANDTPVTNNVIEKYIKKSVFIDNFDHLGV